MRIFKWTTDCRCSEESPIVPVWISFPYLPIHFVQCKEALFSIASAIGKPLRIDQATASLSRPSVARVLIERDVTQPLLPRIRIGVGNSGFWQNVLYEKIPHYCASCKPLGNAAETCYVANPGLRPQRPNRAPQANPHMSKAREAPPPGTSPRAPDSTPEYSSLAIQIMDFRSPITVIFPVEADVPDPVAAPDMTPEPSSLGIQIVDYGSPITMIFPVEVDVPDAATASATTDIPSGNHDRTVVGFNTHCTDIPSSEETSDAVETSDEEETKDAEQQLLGYHDPGRPGPDPDFSDS
ncbi:hypothetical protein AB3S75_016127 [Citrus x aurantiifolia]